MALTDLQLNQLAALNAGRYPAWQSAEPYAGGASNPGRVTPPGEASAGVDVSNAQLALVSVELRRRADRDAVRINIDRQAGAASYEFDIGATTYTYNSIGATNASVIADELAAIVFDEGDGYIASAVAFDDEYDGVLTAALDVWRLDGARPTEPTNETNVSPIDRSADAVSVTIWGQPYGTTQWLQVGQVEGLALTSNWCDLIRVSPLSRVCVQVTGIDRTSDYPERVVVSVGSCQAEPS